MQAAVLTPGEGALCARPGRATQVPRTVSKMRRSRGLPVVRSVKAPFSTARASVPAVHSSCSGGERGGRRVRYLCTPAT